MPPRNYEKPDYWTQKAFSEEYPARSVYKLKEMDEKFSLVKKDQRVLDLGAAPGSWTIYVLRKLDGNGHITAVDLNPLAKDVKGVHLSFFQGDMFSPEIQKAVREKGPYNTVICDAAPPTTGNRTVDTARSAGIAELAMYYAEEYLLKGGNFAVKVFQGGEEQQLLKKLKALFTTARAFKPEACRRESFETYLVGTGKK